MKTLYIDCSGGVSGDMLLRALEEISGTDKASDIELAVGENGHRSGDLHCHEHERNHGGRSYNEVRAIIAKSSGQGVTQNARAYAAGIYSVIAEAEAAVHGETIETVHFHEVGRDRAILNALGIGRALDSLGFTADGKNKGEPAGRIYISQIFDGSGFVDCAHGRIPVPVPAVKAMMKKCGERTGPGYGFTFCTAEEVNTEMVTPTGLAALMGIGAEAAPGGFVVMGKITAEAEANGTRNTGRSGLRVFLIED